MNNTKSNTEFIENPHCNLEAEQSVLGAILLDDTVLSEVTEILPEPKFFYFDAHRQIYKIFLKMLADGVKIDYLTTLEHAKHISVYGKLDMKTYLFELTQAVPAISNAVAYAEIVKESFVVRSLLEISEKIAKNVNQNFVGTHEILRDTQEKLHSLEREKSQKGLKKIDKTVMKVLEIVDSLSINKTKPTGISTGISELDDIISGLNAGDLILLAARPGMGKTAFALNIATSAVLAHKTVAFFSLEMSQEQLVSRLICSTAEISDERLKTGNLTDPEWKKLLDCTSTLNEIPLFVDDTSGITIPEITSRIQRLGSIELVVVDYLQLMQSTKKAENRTQEVSGLTRDLKIMAKTLNVPVVVLSQLSRAVEQRVDHRPLLSDLRDSGSIEQDADIVLFLYREGYYANTAKISNKTACDCIVAKNRHGKTGTVPLCWQGEFFKFSGLELAKTVENLGVDPFVA